MGVTTKSINLINKVLSLHNVKSVCDLGAQNDYQDSVIKKGVTVYPFMSEWWKARGVHYESIDLSGQNGCHVLDLTKPIDLGRSFDLVCDFGTSEHVSGDSFDSDKLLQCYKNIDNLCEIGGYIIHVNPKTGNWPTHCNTYYTEDFHKQFAEAGGYDLIHIGEWAAMDNTIDGWEIVAVLKKNNEFKITKKQWSAILKTMSNK